MLGSLIKYEFRVTSRIIPLFYLAALAAAVSTAVSDSMKLRIPSLTSASLLIVAGILVMYGTAIYLVIRFYKGVYGPEGYLTMTLPARERHILLSRGIVAAVWSLLGCACFTATFYYSISMIIKYTEDNAEKINAAINMFGGGFMWFVFFGASIGVLAFLSEAYMCVTIAHVRPFRKLGLGAAAIGYAIIYVAEQILSMPIMLFVPLSLKYTRDVGWSLTNASMFTSMSELFTRTASENPPNIGVASLFLSAFLLIVCAVVTLRLMKNKINLR